MTLINFFIAAILLVSCNALNQPGVDRRRAIQASSVLLTSSLSPKVASAATDTTAPKGSTVLVLGAGGQTGQECISALLANNRRCVATTRSGQFEASANNNLLTVATADVTSQESIQSAIASTKNLGAVIFAASVSGAAKDRNAAFSVDRDGVVNAAKCCIAANIPRLVVVSSGSVSRPDSAIYLLLNTVGKGIMEAKIQGEDTIRELYADPSVISKGLGYTIVRPGGLTTEESLGPSAVELNQGDTKSGRIARADVASICINSLESSDAFDTTFECYDTLTAKPLEAVGLSNILKSKDPTTFKTGFERQGETWPSLFAGLTRDVGHEA